MHENGFEFEANLKHYQRAVNLMTSLPCSIRIWLNILIEHACAIEFMHARAIEFMLY